MKLSLKILTIALLMLFCIPLFSQRSEYIVRGKVIDKSSGEPIIGATVKIKGTETGTCTGKDGRYELRYRMPTRHHAMTLEYRSVGYKSSSLRVDCPGVENLDVGLSRDYLNLDGLTVTATRTEKTLSCSPIVTRLISQKDIARISAPSVKDLLEYEIPGVEFSVHGGQTNVKMQGFESGYILFLVDGEELSGQNNGNIDLQRISPEQIERVEVIKGAGSALYGSNAVAGVINIITKTGKKPFSLFASAGYNSPEHYKAYGEVGLNRRSVRSTTSASYDDMHEYKIFDKDKKGYTPMPGNKVFRAGEKFSWKASSVFGLKANLSYTDRTQYKSPFEHQVNRTFSAYGSGVYNVSDEDVWTLSANQDVTLRGVRFPKKPESDSTAYKNYLSMIRLQNDRAIGESLNLNLGVEYHAEGINSFQIAYNKETKWAQWGVFFGQGLHKMSDYLSLVYGLRMDLHSSYGFHLSPKLGFVAEFGGFKFRGGYSCAFKAPNLMELYFNWYHENGGGFRITGNPDLKPETARQLNLSGEYTVGRISLSASAQYTKFRHKIVMTQDKDYNLHYDNARGSSPIFGVEAGLIWRPLDALRISANYSYVDDDTKLDINGQKVSVRSSRPHSVTALMSYILKMKNYDLDLSFMGRYNSALKTYLVASGTGRSVDDAKSVRYEPYFISRLVLNQRFFERYMLSLGIDNLFDYKTDRVSTLSPLTPGRSYFAKISVSI